MQRRKTEHMCAQQAAGPEPAADSAPMFGPDAGPGSTSSGAGPSGPACGRVKTRHEADPIAGRNELRHNDVVKNVGLVAARLRAPCAAPARSMRRFPAIRTSPRPVRRVRRAGWARDSGTRGRIARLILENGPVTAAGLSARLGLTSAAVRRHLDNLEADQLGPQHRSGTPGVRPPWPRPPRPPLRVDGRRPQRPVRVRRPRGRRVALPRRPGRAGRSQRFAPPGPGSSANDRAHGRAAVAVDDRPEALAEALTRRRLRRRSVPAPRPAAQLCQHHCPVPHVAAAVPAAVRGGDRCFRPAARHACSAARDHRPRRRRLHDARPAPTPGPHRYRHAPYRSPEE